MHYGFTGKILHVDEIQGWTADGLPISAKLADLGLRWAEEYLAPTLPGSIGK